MSILDKGYHIPFYFDPPTTLRPPAERLPSDLSRRQVLEQEVTNLLSKRAIEKVTDNSPGFYSHLFLVKKKNGKYRPIIDLSCLNRFIALEKFKMETTRSIRESILPGEWAVSIDLTDAYLHVPIHHSSRKYLRFLFDGVVYQFRVLPFGLSTAPFVFTKLMVVVAAAVRRTGSPVIQYFDDWLLHQAQRSTLLTNLTSAWDVIQSVGLIPNREKSDLVPSQTFTYVGMFFRTHLGLVSVPPPRVDALVILVRSTLSVRQISARGFLSLLGVLNAAADLVHLGRLHMRPLQLYLLCHWTPSTDSLEASVPILPPLRPHLEWWLDRERLSAGVPISLPDPELTLLTDASLQGWGAHLEPTGLMMSGTWSLSEKQLHINNLELKAVSLALRRALSHVQRRCVMIESDNSTTVSYIRRQGGTHSLSLHVEARDLLLWCSDHHITLRAKHIPGHLNVLADYLSRGGERHFVGVVPSPHGSSPVHKPLGTTDGGSLCQQAELQASAVCLTGARRSGDGEGRPLSELGQPRRVCVSPVQLVERGSQEAQSHHELSDDSSGPSVVQQVMVQPTLGPVSGQPQGSTTNPKSAKPARRQNPASQSGGPPPSRVEALSRSIVKRGFSKKAASLIAQAKRPSTSKVYDAKWTVFTDWCHRRKIDPLHPSLGKVADFLVFLFEEKHCRPSTIKGYRSALSNTLKFGHGRGKDIGSDPRLSELIRNFERSRPAMRTVVPRWNLSCVLWSLTKAPYEPLASASLLLTSVKTAFLLALASAKRRSELHALSIEEGCISFTSCLLYTSPSPRDLSTSRMPSSA